MQEKEIPDVTHKAWYGIAGALGFILMSYELFVTRMVAPTVGLSVYTWTAAIGWVLLGMSIGAWIGGYYADKYPKHRATFIALTLGVSALALMAGFIAARFGLLLVSHNMIASVLVITFLVAFPFAFCISTVMPHIAALVIDRMGTVGRHYSYLSFAHALGSIAGVFLTGFFFFEIIPLSISIACLGVALVLIAVGIAYAGKPRIGNIRVIAALCIYLALWFLLLRGGLCITHASGIYCTDTQYYTARIVDAPFYGTPSRVLFLDADAHSVATNKNEPALYRVFEYLPRALHNDPATIAVLGAGAYIAPQSMSTVYPNATIDVIDIDASLKKIATDFFYPDLSSRITAVTSDARWFLAHTGKRYDVIVGDLYNSLIALPFHTTTREYMETVKARLTDNGIYIFAFVDDRSAAGGKNRLADALYQTAKSVFPSVRVFALGDDPASAQNIVIVASQSALPDYFTLTRLLNRDVQLADTAPYVVENPDALFSCTSSCILTDDFSPIEKLLMPVERPYFASLVTYLKNTFK